MKKHMQNLLLALLGSAAVFSGSTAMAATFNDVFQAAAQMNAQAKRSQAKIDDLTEETRRLLNEYKTVLKEVEGLKVYNRQLEKQIGNQEQEMVQLAASIDEVTIIERQITPLMLRMIDGLEQFVELDAPFLLDERRGRVERLREMMDRADVAASEKFRRVMEAYQVEMDYGRTMEAYSGIHSINGQERDVEFLRLGRTALIYQTRDASMQGVWNKQTRQWEELDSSYRTQITKGLRMAKKQLAPDLLMLPVAITD